MTKKIFNRPYVEGRPLEGPLPFTELVTIVDAEAIGGIDIYNYDSKKLSASQLAKLAIFRENYPINYNAKNGGVTYPPGALEFAGEQSALRRAESEAVTQSKVGKNIISRLIHRKGEK